MHSKRSVLPAALALALLAAPEALRAVDYNNGGGTQWWGTVTNWNGTPPNAAGTTARMLTSGVSANQILLLADATGADASFTVGTFTIGSVGGSAAQHYQLNNVSGGTQRLVFDVASGNATLTFGSVFANAAMTVNTGLTLNDNLTVNVNRAGGTHTIAGQISSGVAGTGVTFNIVNNALLRVTSANDYSGSTVISNGRLTLTSTGSIASSSPLTIQNNAAFDVSSKAAYALGSGGVTLGIGESTAGLFDAGAATLTLDNALTLNFSSTTLANSYNLLDFGAQVGDFDSITLTGSIVGSLVLTSPDTWTGTVGDYVFSFSETNGILTTSAIPEPSTYAALLGGLAAATVLAGRPRRRS